MEILSILTGAFVAGCDLGIKKYTEENVRDGEERRIWKGKGIYRKVHNKRLQTGKAWNIADAGRSSW